MPASLLVYLLKPKHVQAYTYPRGSNNLLHAMMFVYDAFEHHERAEK